MRAENDTPGREPLDAAGLRRAALRPGGLWREIEVVPSTGSTNADLLARALTGQGPGLTGQPEGVLLAAEEQTAGRGRIGRTWTSPPYAALTFSLLLHPAVPAARRGWLPLLAGVAVATAVTDVTGVPTRLKWPNDVLAGTVQAGSAQAGTVQVGEGKLAGILAEAAGDAVVVGIGLNVSTEPAELPGPGPGALPATSLRMAGATALNREKLLLAILACFERWYRAWRQAGGDPDRSGLRAEYTRLSATIGRSVRAELPGGQALSGLAVGVDSDGRLLVRVSPGSEVPVAAADVVHLR
jgi:BirA family transcriptional regulator, biotin operon repressor / biotin---[acetyl-CoA-carboxylase] ligase